MAMRINRTLCVLVFMTSIFLRLRWRASAKRCQGRSWKRALQHRGPKSLYNFATVILIMSHIMMIMSLIMMIMSLIMICTILPPRHHVIQSKMYLSYLQNVFVQIVKSWPCHNHDGEKTAKDAKEKFLKSIATSRPKSLHNFATIIMLLKANLEIKFQDICSSLKFKIFLQILKSSLF